ncbi:MAG: MFS transporter [Candidatus Muirbacterium halophilum]|nr:MFS transporter [Candidatus Muirbacterium halophilum]MCK9474651.1 MFS transporter [Candidatus Muirbacterium halophilum]
MNKLLIFDNKNFGLLWFGQMVSQIGDRIFSIAVMWYILDITNSAQSASYVMFFSIIPVILLACFTGVVVDRFNKKNIIVLSDIIRGILIIFLSVLFFKNLLQPWHIYCFLFLIGCVSALFNPAISASIPFIVKSEKIDKAMAYQSSIRDMSVIFGAGIGGLLISSIGIGWSFFINGISYIFSAFAEMPIKIRNIEKKIENSFFADMKQGFDFAFKNITVRKMLFLFMIMNFFGPPMILIIPIIVKQSSFGVEWFAIFEIALAVGSILGAISVNYICKNFNVKNFITLNMVLSGILLILLGFSSSKLNIFIIQFLFGIVLAYININLMIIFQKITPDNIKGRFFSILETVSCFVVPLSFLVAGITIEKYGYYNNLFVMGTAIVISSIYFYFIPGLGDARRASIKN